MSTIGGPGGIGGPKGPSAPDDVGEPDAIAPEHAVEGAAHAGNLDAIAADLAAGKLTPQEAIERLVDQIADGSELPAAERAELRELMADLVANDPHLGALIHRM